jgi:murein DD-endopeptidase MepM/ murein hydrolase activator NlpD
VLTSNARRDKRACVVLSSPVAGFPPICPPGDTVSPGTPCAARCGEPSQSVARTSEDPTNRRARAAELPAKVYSIAVDRPARRGVAAMSQGADSSPSRGPHLHGVHAGLRSLTSPLSTASPDRVVVHTSPHPTWRHRHVPLTITSMTIPAQRSPVVTSWRHRPLPTNRWLPPPQGCWPRPRAGKPSQPSRCPGPRRRWWRRPSTADRPDQGERSQEGAGATNGDSGGPASRSRRQSQRRRGTRSRLVGAIGAAVVALLGPTGPAEPAHAAVTTGHALSTSADRSSSTDGARSTVTWTWPLSPPQIERLFDPPSHPWGAGHRGVDLAGAEGQAVRSAGAGVVVYAGLLAGRGVVSVSHGALRTTYEPVAPAVRAGTRVAAGSVLGTLTTDRSHCQHMACLHWGLRQGDRYLDPLSLIATGPPRLLPHLGQDRLPRAGPVRVIRSGGRASAHEATAPGVSTAISSPAPGSRRLEDDRSAVSEAHSATRAAAVTAPARASRGRSGAELEDQPREPDRDSGTRSLTAFIGGVVAGAATATLVVRAMNARRLPWENPTPRPPTSPGAVTSADSTVVPLRRSERPPTVAV